MTTIFNKAIWKVEGLCRGILYSKEKVKCYRIIRYQKTRVRQYTGSPIDGDKINKLKNISNINDDSEGLDYVKIKLQDARES